MKITQVNTRFVVETGDGKFHVLNEKALKWNLRYVFNLGKQASGIVKELKAKGSVEVAA